MRESDFTKPKYTLIINGEAKITKKDFFELNRLAKEYKEKHPEDDVKVMPSKELDEANIKGMFRKGMKNIKRALTPGIKGKLANKGDALLMKGIKASNIATTDKQLKQADRMVHHSGRLRKLGKGLNPFAPYPEEPRKYPEVIKPGETRDVVIPIPSRNRAVRVRIERQDTYRYAYFTYRDEEGNEQGDEFDVYAFPSLQSVFDKKILPEIYYYDTGDSAKFVNGKIVHSDPSVDDEYLEEDEITETSSTGQGGGSAGIGGGSMVGGPRTYEEEFGPFKKKGKFKRTTAMTY